VELRRCQVMEKKLGEEFAGTISSVAEFGFFVELDEYFVDGLVHVRSLQNDYFYFDPKTHSLIGERRRQAFKVGMRVRIKVAGVELGRRRLDFTLVEVG
jgi:ribonuclease R